MVVFVHPILYSLDGEYPFVGIHAQVVDAVRERGMIAYDLLEAFRGYESTSLWVHPGDQHPNEIAHFVAAAYAAGKLEEALPACGGTWIEE